jgi:histidyl-tRNA synthetase
MTAKLSSLIGIYGERSTVVERLAPICTSSEAMAALSELSALDKLLTARGIGEKVRFDFSVVNNMSYYNGIVFKGFLSGICDGVLAGGEYDNLLRSMKQDRRGIGFALYLDLLEELEEDCEEYDALDASYFFGEAADSVCVNPIMYPDRKTIERCAMMHDTDTEALLKMWARVKGANASAWTYILIVLVLGGLIFSVVLKYYRQNSRKKRYRKPKRKS